MLPKTIIKIDLSRILIRKDIYKKKKRYYNHLTLLNKKK